MNNGVKRRRLIVPKKENKLLTTYPLTLTSKINKIGMNETTVNNNRNVCEMKQRSLVNTGYISPEII